MSKPKKFYQLLIKSLLIVAVLMACTIIIAPLMINLEMVRENIENLSPGGGFVFNTIHNILPDVPPENIIAMFAAIDEYR